jgi:hypothetical protein
MRYFAPRRSGGCVNFSQARSKGEISLTALSWKILVALSRFNTIFVYETFGHSPLCLHHRILDCSRPSRPGWSRRGWHRSWQHFRWRLRLSHRPHRHIPRSPWHHGQPDRPDRDWYRLCGNFHWRLIPDKSDPPRRTALGPEHHLSELHFSHPSSRRHERIIRLVATVCKSRTNIRGNCAARFRLSPNCSVGF